MLNFNFVGSTLSRSCTRWLYKWQSTPKMNTLPFRSPHFDRGDAFSHLFYRFLGLFILLSHNGDWKLILTESIVLQNVSVYLFRDYRLGFFNFQRLFLLIRQFWSRGRRTSNVKCKELTMSEPYRFLPSHIIKDSRRECSIRSRRDFRGWLSKGTSSCPGRRLK
jgi:hypothetical protein